MFCLSQKIALCSFISYVFAVSPQAVQWSSKSYGPDGPWQAITIGVGTPFQYVDLLPGGLWASNVLHPNMCANNALCDVAKTSGFYDPAMSSTVLSTEANFEGSNEIGVLPSARRANWTLDTISISVNSGTAGAMVTVELESSDLVTVSAANETLPDGTTYPLQVGKLGLGAPDANHSWVQPPPTPNMNSTLLPSALFEKGLTPSNSYGLHIGSTTMGIPGSLIFGGFDQSRVLGPVSSQAYTIAQLPIDLLDVGLGIAEGMPPSNFTPQSGLLAKGNSSIGFSTSVFVEATTPYIYLPHSACDAITASLPVTYQKKYGMYFWNTNDSNYKRLITSPTFLSFTFRLSASLSQNITIKIPFALLNLTLSAPIISTPTMYLPIRPGPGPSGSYELGRAFMQAAFIGVNWQTATASGPGAWFLAQAPGPNTPSNTPLKPIAVTDSTIVGSASAWKDSWKGVWTTIAETSTSISETASSTASNVVSSTTGISASISSNISSSQKKGLTSGATAGIAIGAAVIALGVVAIGIFFYKRLKAKRQRVEASLLNDWAGNGDAIAVIPNVREPKRFSQFKRAELDTEQKPTELTADPALKSPIELG